MKKFILLFSGILFIISSICKEQDNYKITLIQEDKDRILRDAISSRNHKLAQEMLKRGANPLSIEVTFYKFANEEVRDWIYVREYRNATKSSSNKHKRNLPFIRIASPIRKKTITTNCA